jgi:hypothetical protein
LLRQYLQKAEELLPPLLAMQASKLALHDAPDYGASLASAQLV